MKNILTCCFGIGLFCLFLSVFTAAATASGPEVTFDGKVLSFPGDARHPAPFNISDLKFELDDSTPNFVRGKVFKFQFLTARHGMGIREGLKRYGIVTRWVDGTVEIFYYPSDQRFPKEEPFLDCPANGVVGSEHLCTIRGRTVGNTYRLTFFEDGNIKIKTVGDGAEASSEIVPGIAIPTAVQTGSLQ